MMKMMKNKNAANSSSPSILVVEDDEATLESISLKLKKEGFEVDSAGDNAAGLEKLRRNPNFSGVLLDLRLPQGDGFGFLEGKSKESNLSNIPVIVFTNLNQREYVEKALGLGAKGYLVKANHDISDIIKQLKKCLKGEKCQIDL